MKTLEVRRHSLTKKGSERGSGSHISREGVALARQIGSEIGPFDHVLVSTVPRTLETALAMGFAVDDAIDPGLDKEFWSEVEKHDHWTSDDPFGGYRDAIAAGGAVAKLAGAQRAAWIDALERVPDGGAVLAISHGHATESGLVLCLGDADWKPSGGPFGNLEGFRCSYEGGTFTEFEILRVDASWRERHSLEDVLAADGPWYGLPDSNGVLRWISGWGGGTHHFHLSLQHQWADRRSLAIDTRASRDLPAQLAAWEALTRWFNTRVMLADIKPEHFPLRFEVLRHERDVVVDGEPTRFVVIGDELSWVADGMVGERFVELRSFGVPLDEVVITEVDPATEYRHGRA